MAPGICILKSILDVFDDWTDLIITGLGRLFSVWSGLLKHHHLLGRMGREILKWASSDL